MYETSFFHCRDPPRHEATYIVLAFHHARSSYQPVHHRNNTLIPRSSTCIQWVDARYYESQNGACYSSNETAKAAVNDSRQASALPCQEVNVAAGSATCSNRWQLENIGIFYLNVRLDTGRFERLSITGVLPNAVVGNLRERRDLI